MLTGHPERYTDAQLDDWIRSLVDQSMPENRRLDYKAQPGERREEWAKDITSFANELGGVLLYGIPESRNTEGAPIPNKRYGMDPIPGFEQDLENVYTSVVTPLLPTYHIRKVHLSEYPDKVCYVVWTPESWAGPHMLTAYQDHRFYRRGEFRAIMMTERDVEERYRRRLQLRGAATKFMESDAAWHKLRGFPAGVRTTTFMVIPYLLIPNRIMFHEQDTRAWLTSVSSLGHWSPSVHGVLMHSGTGEDQQIIEMHRNGAVVAHHTTSGKINEHAEGFVIAHLAEIPVWRQYIELARHFYEHIGYDGPVTTSVVMKLARMRNHHTLSLTDCGPFLLRHPGLSDRRFTRPEERIEFEIDSSASELALRPNKVLREAADELYRVFGQWQADCFDEHDQLVSS